MFYDNRWEAPGLSPNKNNLWETPLIYSSSPPYQCISKVLPIVAPNNFICIILYDHDQASVLALNSCWPITVPYYHSIQLYP